MYWDTSKVDMTLTMPAGDYAGAGQTITMSVQNWYYCMNGLAAYENQPYTYDWSAGSAPVEARLIILSALEEITIKESRSIMLIAEGGGSFLSAKFSYISTVENTFMGFGGLRYIQVNYTDEEWAEFVADHNYNLSEVYKQSEEETTPVDPAAKSEGVMTYAEYAAAAMDSKVVIEAYVQATQSWWANKITVYLQDPDGAYFAYGMACSEADATKLTKGTKIRVTGYKGTWAGEIEILDGTFEFVESVKWIAEATDVTALLGTEELIKHQNKFVCFKGLTIEAINYKHGEPGDDIYVDVSLNGNTYSFVVECYLTGPETDVYKAVVSLKTGDKVDIEGFLYWYEGVSTQITSVKRL